MFRVAGISRLRAKQLSAAEVKRGLRRNVTGGGQNVIPTMSFYSQKVLLLTVGYKVAEYDDRCVVCATEFAGGCSLITVFVAFFCPRACFWGD